MEFNLKPHETGMGCIWNNNVKFLWGSVAKRYSVVGISPSFSSPQGYVGVQLTQAPDSQLCAFLPNPVQQLFVDS